jgi:hypothetical protein
MAFDEENMPENGFKGTKGNHSLIKKLPDQFEGRIIALHGCLAVESPNKTKLR